MVTGIAVSLAGWATCTDCACTSSTTGDALEKSSSLVVATFCCCCCCAAGGGGGGGGDGDSEGRCGGSEVDKCWCWICWVFCRGCMPRFCHVGGVFIDGLDIGGRCGL